MRILLIFGLFVFTFNSFAQKSPENEKSKAEQKSESNIIGNVYQADYSKSKIIYPSDLANSVPKAIVVKGSERTLTKFDSLNDAKEFSKKNKQANVITLDKQTKKYSLYELIIGENSPVAVELAETPFRKALNNKPSVPMTYEALKISPDYSLQVLASLINKRTGSSEVADIVDAEGLSLIKKTNMQLMAGSKGIRLLFDSELEKSNFDEALKIYQWLEKLNAKSNDLDVVKITRKTNLSKLYRADEKLKPFVEAEMVKWNYAEGDKNAVRGMKAPASANSSASDPEKTNPTNGKFAVGEIVDLQSAYVDTFWHKAEIVEIVGDKYKVRKVNNNYNKYTEIVTAQKLRPFTTPVKYQVGQKVEAMDKGVWYKGEIISNDGSGYFGIRFEGTTNRSDRYDQTEEFMRPLNSSSTAQTKQEYSSPLWMAKFGISEQLLTKKMLAEASNDFVGCESKYNTLVPPTKLETSSSRAFADVVGGSGEDNKFLLVYAIGKANLTRIKGINVKTSSVGFTKPELLIKRQETNEAGRKINLIVIPLVFKGSDSYQIEAEPNNDDYTGIVKIVCSAAKSSSVRFTAFTPTNNGSSSGNAILSKAKESSIDANLTVKRAEISFITQSARAKKTDKERIEPAKQILRLQNELVQYLTDAINGKELTETAKAKYRKILETEKLQVQRIENLVKVTVEAAKYEP